MPTTVSNGTCSKKGINVGRIKLSTLFALVKHPAPPPPSFFMGNCHAIDCKRSKPVCSCHLRVAIYKT